jgi:hypothetical protein
MARRSGDPFEAELEYVNGFDMAHGPESFDRMAPNPAVHFADLFVREARIRFRHRHERALVPDTKRVVGQQAGAFAAPRLCVNQHGVNRVWIDLPFPPVASPSSHSVRRRRPLEHQSFDSARTRLAALIGDVVPSRG